MLVPQWLLVSSRDLRSGPLPGTDQKLQKIIKKGDITQQHVDI